MIEDIQVQKSRELTEMDNLFDQLFPIFRSITGPGVRETLSILSKQIPLEMFSVPSGKSIFDWSVPKEWIIREAWIKDSNGNEIINIKNNNLHVVNYSLPVNKRIRLEELKEHIYTVPHLPNAIPYVISYYKDRWGFCMSQEMYDQLEDGEYHVFIDSEHIAGELNYAHSILPGKSNKEILISTYICHPSMANNELSGPIVSTFLYKRLAKWSNREFTYRFVFIPETIGSLVYLHEQGDHFVNNIYSGAVLTCLGGKQLPLSFKQSRNEDAPLNRLIEYLVAQEGKDISIRPFSPLGGSDERQYCSPGFNLPVGQFSRMIYGQYDGYHNSLDTKEIMTIEALQKSVDEIEEILKLQELDGYYINEKPFGEPKLGKYNLYPDINAPTTRLHSNSQTIDNRQQLNQILMLLSYSDGQHKLSEVASRAGYNLFDFTITIDQLRKNQLLSGPYFVKRELRK